MAKLSAFADEIGKDLDLQITTLKENGVANIELRGVWGKNVLSLEPQEIRRIKTAAEGNGIGFSAIGSPLGKFPLDDDFQKELDGLKRALDYAEQLGAPYIRLFSYYIPKGDDPASHRTHVLDWLSQLVEEAEKTSIILAHENESGIYGDIAERCLDIFENIRSSNFTGVFDFSNFVQQGQSPYEDCWSVLKEYISYFHIKDSRKSDKTVVPAGEGDGDVKRILQEAYENGFDGFLTLEPHLSKAAANYGQTSPELFRVAVDALNRVLRSIGQ